MCLSIIPVPDSLDDIATKNAKAKLLNTLYSGSGACSSSTKEEFRQMYDATVVIDTKHGGFDVELEMCFLQLESHSVGISNIGYILKAQLDHDAAQYYAVTCGHSVVSTRQNIIREPENYCHANDGVIMNLPRCLLHRPLLAESIVPQGIQPQITITSQRRQYNCTYICAKHGLYLASSHFPFYYSPPPPPPEKLNINADVAVVKLPHSMHVDIINNPQSFKKDFGRFTSLNQIRLNRNRKICDIECKLRMVSRRGSNFLVRDFTGCKVTFVVYYDKQQVPVITWTYRNVEKANHHVTDARELEECKPQEGDSGSPIFLIREQANPLLLGQFFAAQTEEEANCNNRPRLFLATRYDEAIRLVKPFIVRDLLKPKIRQLMDEEKWDIQDELQVNVGVGKKSRENYQRETVHKIERRFPTENLISDCYSLN